MTTGSHITGRTTKYPGAAPKMKRTPGGTSGGGSSGGGSSGGGSSGGALPIQDEEKRTVNITFTDPDTGKVVTGKITPEEQREIIEAGRSRVQDLNQQQTIQKSILERQGYNVSTRTERTGGVTQLVATKGGRQLVITQAGNVIEAPATAIVQAERVTTTRLKNIAEAGKLKKEIQAREEAKIKSAGRGFPAPRLSEKKEEIKPSTGKYGGGEIRAAPKRTVWQKIVNAPILESFKSGLFQEPRADTIRAKTQIERDFEDLAQAGGVALGAYLYGQGLPKAVKGAQVATKAVKAAPTFKALSSATKAVPPLNWAKNFGVVAAKTYAGYKGTEIVGRRLLLEREEREFIKSQAGAKTLKEARTAQDIAVSGKPWYKSMIYELPLAEFGIESGSYATGVQKQLIQQGYRGTELAQKAKLIQTERKIRAAGEAVGFLVGSAGTEIAGRGAFVTSYKKLGTVPRKKLTGKLFGEAFKITAPLGFAEAGSQAWIQQRARMRDFSAQNIAIEGSLGAASAGLFGGAIVGLRVSKPTISKGINLFANVLDPYEYPGDVLASISQQFSRKAFGKPIVKAIVLTPSPTPKETVSLSTMSISQSGKKKISMPTIATTTSKKQTPFIRIPTITPTITPTVTPTITHTVTPSVTPTITPTVTPTITPTVTPSVTPTITPTVTPSVTPTIIPTITPTFTPTFTPTITPTITPTQTPVEIPTVTPILRGGGLPLPPFLDAMGGRGGMGRSLRKRYVNELAAGHKLLLKSLSLGVLTVPKKSRMPKQKQYNTLSLAKKSAKKLQKEFGFNVGILKVKTGKSKKSKYVLGRRKTIFDMF